MAHEEITTQEIRSCLKTIKAVKAAGPDGLNPHFFFYYIKERGVQNTFERKPKCNFDKWQCSRNMERVESKYDSKVKNPEAKNVRPNSLTISYKIFVKIIKERIGEHLRNSNKDKEDLPKENE